MALLEVSDIHARYGSIEALKGVSLTVDEGEVVTLIGSNGAGKSTTLRSISGLTPASAGKITFAGEDITRVPAHEIVIRGIALAPEGRHCFPRMTVRENLDLGAHRRRGPEIADDLDRVYELFPRLKERERQKAGTMSGGEQQMLAIGRALMARPKLLMLDEPSLGHRPDPGAADLRDHRRDQPLRGRDPPGRAERQLRARGRRPRLRAGDRPGGLGQRLGAASATTPRSRRRTWGHDQHYGTVDHRWPPSASKRCTSCSCG